MLFFSSQLTGNMTQVPGAMHLTEPSSLPDSSHHSQQKSPKCSTWMQSLNERMISVCFQGKPFNIVVIQVYAMTSNAEEAEVEQFYKDPQDILELTPKKDILFIIGDWNTKIGNQEISGVTGKFGLGVQNAGQFHCRSIKKCRMNLR